MPMRGSGPPGCGHDREREHAVSRRPGRGPRRAAASRRCGWPESAHWQLWMVTELREGRLLELVNLVIDAHGSRVAKVLYRRHRDDNLALVRALAAAAGVGIEQPGRAFRDADQVTILTGRGRAAKLITPGGIDSYAAGRWFAVTTVEVRGIAELASVLRQLERAPYSFIIRAKLIEGLDPKCVRRLLHADQASGEGPYFEPCPRRWVGLDFDGLDLPIGVSAVDLDAVAALAVARLPEPLRPASCWAQLTSSAGLKQGGRVRLFYWLDRAVRRAELKRWLGDVLGLDFATLNDVTPNYVAKPIFIGVQDPVTIRSKVIAGAVDAVAVPDLPEPKPARPRARPATFGGFVGARPRGAPSFSSGGSEPYLRIVVDGVRHAPAGQGRQALTSAALRLYGAARAGRVDRNRATALLKRAMLDRGWSADETTRGMTLGDVSRLLDWCWEHSEPM